MSGTRPHLPRILSDHKAHHNQHRPHRSLSGAAPLKPLPEPVNLDLYRIRRQAQVAGDKVVVWYTSANRDEAVFRDPYRLDLRRSPNPHTTFGRGGPHRCLGEHLARLELRVLLCELVPVLPRLESDGPPARIRSNFTNGLKRFPVRIS